MNVHVHACAVISNVDVYAVCRVCVCMCVCVYIRVYIRVCAWCVHVNECHWALYVYVFVVCVRARALSDSVSLTVSLCLSLCLTDSETLRVCMRVCVGFCMCLNAQCVCVRLGRAGEGARELFPWTACTRTHKHTHTDSVSLTLSLTHARTRTRRRANAYKKSCSSMCRLEILSGPLPDIFSIRYRYF
jgi:hypothetical protein